MTMLGRNSRITRTMSSRTGSPQIFSVSSGVLAAFAAGDGEQRDVGVEAAGEISEDSAAFVIGMRGDVEDARGDASGVDSFDGFGKAGARAGGGRELGARGEC